MNKLFVENNPLIAEASAVKVVTEDGDVLVYFQGPMSMSAAGMFIKYFDEMGQSLGNPFIQIAVDNWKE